MLEHVESTRVDAIELEGRLEANREAVQNLGYMYMYKLAKFAIPSYLERFRSIRNWYHFRRYMQAISKPSFSLQLRSACSRSQGR